MTITGRESRQAKEARSKMNVLLATALALSGVQSPIGSQMRDSPNVVISVIHQQKFRNSGHHPWNNRRVTFRLTNRSDTPAIVYGLKVNSGFYPAGYMLEREISGGKWRYPTGGTSDPGLQAIPELERDRYTLAPGMTIDFQAEMSFTEVGRHFKRTAYITLSGTEVSNEIASKEFVLK
jgi:hypothetical protein